MSFDLFTNLEKAFFIGGVFSLIN